MQKALIWMLRVLTGVAAIALIWLSAAKIEQVHERSVATSAVEAIATIELGSTTRSKVEALLRSYSTYRVAKLEDNSLQLGFMNRRGLLFVRPSQWILITLEFENDRVTAREMLFAEDPRRAAIVRQSINPAPILSVTGTSEDRNVDIVGRADALYSIVRVDEDTNVGSQRLAADWQFDFRCFQFTLGCKDMITVLPGAKINRSLRN